MSRLIVKNLPLKITEDKLRSTFSKKGVITDLQLKFSKEGKFRGFAFVGFKDETEAENARAYFNGTYIGASKVDVQICKNLGEANQAKRKKNKENQKIEEDQTNKDAEKKKKKKEIKSLLEKYADDPKFQEFLSVYQRKNGESWTNESLVDVESRYLNQTSADKPPDNQTNQNDTKKDKLKHEKEYFYVKLYNLPYKFKKKNVKAFLAPLKLPSIRIPPKIHGIAYVGLKTEKERNQALNKHKSLCDGQQIFVIKFDKKEKGEEKEEKVGVNSKWKAQEEGVAGEESVGESGRIFVRNLAYTVTEEELESLFSKFGPITEVNLPVDKFTRRSKGFAIVTFMMPEHAVKAFADLDGTSYQGRLLHLIPGKSKEEPDDESTEKLGFKKKKALKEKATAGSTHNWNSLFLGLSAVADIVSEKYNVEKADVVLGDSQGGKSAAVRLALGETQIIQETRKYLEEEGVRLEAFEKPPVTRSKTVILAKNLPAFSSASEIRDTFSKYGVLGRVVMPPGGISSVIEFADPGEARKAFTNLAYTKFHNVPLYLEWAPSDAFATPYSESKIEKCETASENENAKGAQHEIGEDAEGHDDDATLFVKNINFDTSDDSLQSHFAKCGKIFSANVATKKDPKSGEILSMGFGFVTYVKKASADRALRELQHSRLDEHALELKRSNRADTKEKQRSQKDTSTGKPSTKILVRNIAFQATKQEITELFKTYGELSAVRLPSKLSGTGSHRGFAFVEFGTKSDAKKAMSELSGSTHLYGRRLVLEWAETEETIDSLRKRTADQYNAGSLSAGKRSKFEIPDTNDD